MLQAENFELLYNNENDKVLKDHAIPSQYLLVQSKQWKHQQFVKSV